METYFITLEYPACIAVNQDSMYAIAKASHSQSDDPWRLLVLIKAENPNAVRDNSWTIVSTTPASYMEENFDIYNDRTFAGLGWVDKTCDVDRNGVVTLRFPGGEGFRYIPWAPKIPQAQTCTSASNGLGEWKRTDITNPNPRLLKGGRRLIIPSENSTLTSNGEQEREMVIFYSPSDNTFSSKFYYTTFDKMAYRSEIMSNPGATTFTLSENITSIETLEYGEGRIFSVFGSGFPNPIPGTDRITNSKTLLYFPFEPFNSSRLQLSPPASAVSIPWNVACDSERDSSPHGLGLVAKEKFYYICAALDSTLPKFKKKFRLNLYIHDSKTKQTRGPFSIESETDLTNRTVRLLPVYNTSQQNEPQFLVINLYDRRGGPHIAIDLSALDGPSQFWNDFNLPSSLFTSERLYPSCRKRVSSRKLIVAWMVSGVFGFAVIAVVFVWRWRKRRSKKNKADQTSPVIAPDHEQELAERSRGPQAGILDDNQAQP